MIKWFRKFFISDRGQRIKNLEFQVIYLHTQIKSIKDVVSQQSEIIAQLAKVQSYVATEMWPVKEDPVKQSEKISVPFLSLAADDDDFIN